MLYSLQVRKLLDSSLMDLPQQKIFAPKFFVDHKSRIRLSGMQENSRSNRNAIDTTNITIEPS